MLLKNANNVGGYYADLCKPIGMSTTYRNNCCNTKQHETALAASGLTSRVFQKNVHHLEQVHGVSSSKRDSHRIHRPKSNHTLGTRLVGRPLFHCAVPAEAGGNDDDSNAAEIEPRPA